MILPTSKDIVVRMPSRRTDELKTILTNIYKKIDKAIVNNKTSITYNEFPFHKDRDFLEKERPIAKDMVNILEYNGFIVTHRRDCYVIEFDTNLEKQPTHINDELKKIASLFKTSLYLFARTNQYINRVTENILNEWFYVMRDCADKDEGCAFLGANILNDEDNADENNLKGIVENIEYVLKKQGFEVIEYKYVPVDVLTEDLKEMLQAQLINLDLEAVNYFEVIWT